MKYSLPSLAVSLVFIVTLFVLAPQTFAQSLEPFTVTGPRTERVNIVILSEGYTSAELTSGKFAEDAQEIADTLLSTEPFKSYRPYFNVYGISVASAQSGADQGFTTANANTYFNASFNSFGIDRLLTIDGVGNSRVYALLNQFLPEYDIVLVVVNDAKYGGSGGAIAVTSTNAAAPEIAIHEIGHSFAGLGDEYDYAGSTPRETPNTTQQTQRSLIKWNIWVNAATPIPTPETSTYGNGLPGLFEGAAYRETGWYRPTLDSMMKSLGVPFYAVNEEAIVKSIYQRVSPITSALPVGNVVTVDAPAQTLPFAVNGPATAAGSPAMVVEWRLNGQVLPGVVGRTTTLSSSALGNGTHTLVAKAKDPTLKVRNDPGLLLEEEFGWTINVSNQGPAAPSNLVATATLDGDVTLTWADLSDDEDGFAIERATATGAFIVVGRVLANTTTFTDTTASLPAGTRYRIGGYLNAFRDHLGTRSNVFSLAAPVIKNHPVGATVIHGQAVAFTITTTGTPLLSYEWRRNKVALSAPSIPTLTLPIVQSSDAGSYDCVVTNAFGTATSKAAALIVQGPPYAESFTVPASVPRGGNVILNVVAKGTPAPTLQWRRNGIAIPGATAGKLTIATAKDSDAGAYDCVLTNSHGSTVTTSAPLAVISGPVAKNNDYRLFGQHAGKARWQWAQRLGGTLADNVSALAFVEGKLVAGGASASTNARFGALSAAALGSWTGRFNPATGVAEWVKGAGSNPATGGGIDSLVATGSGTVLIGGATAAGGEFGQQSLAAGVLSWSTATGTPGSRISGMARASDGTIYVAEVNTTGSHLVKASAVGAVLWQRAVSGGITSLYVDDTDRVFISGQGPATSPDVSFENASPTPPTVVNDPGNDRPGFVASYNADGNVQWTLLHGTQVASVTAGANAGELCCAVNETGETAPLAALLILNSTTGAITTRMEVGNALVSSAVTTTGGEYALLLHSQDANSRYIGGFDIGTPGALVAKYSASGQLLWLLPVNGSADWNPLGQRSRLVAAPDGRLFVALSFDADASVLFAGRAALPMSGKGSDGFLAAIAEVPNVTTPPAPQILALNAALQLTVQTAGLAGTPAYQWYKDSKVLKGKTQSTLDIAAVKVTDAGSYHVRITGSGGSTDSARATVNVIDITPRTLAAPTGKLLDLPVTTAGPGLSYLWKKNATRLFNTGGFLNSTTGRLRISAMSPAFADAYLCTVTGPGGALDVPFTTTVMYRPVFTPPVLPAAIVSGWFELQLTASEAASFSVKNLPPGITYNSKTGLISGRPNGTSSRVITITATNAAGTSDPALVFVLNVGDLAAQAKGGFQALISPQPWNGGLGGFLTYNVSTSGSVTGSIQLAGQKFTLFGRVNANPVTQGWTFQQRFARTGKPALLFNLASPTVMDGALTGTLALEAPTPELATLTGRQTVWGPLRSAALLAGTFNATLSLPVEHAGSGAPTAPGTLKTVVTATTGQAAWSGKLGDNIGFSGSTRLWPDGRVPQWIALYSNLGSLMGTPAISGGQQTGVLDWTRNPKVGAPFWPTVPLNVGTQAAP